MADWHGLTMQSNFTYGKALGTGSIVQATSQWTVPDAYNLHSANRKPGWRSPHVAALRVLLTHQTLTSLQRFVASLRLIAAVSLLASVSHQGWPARMCPFIPSWTLPDVSTKDIILTHTYSVQTAVTRRLLKVSWFSVQNRAKRIRTNQHVVCVRG